MKKLKNKRRELESKKLVFFQIGLIAALLLVLYAFEYKSYEKYEMPDFTDRNTDFDVELISPTIHKKPLPPLPKPITLIKVDLSNKVENVFVEIDVSGNVDTPVKLWEPIEVPEPIIIDDHPLVIAEEMPSFPGGTNSMMRFLSSNIKYPQLAKEVGITGIVYMKFVIEKDGSITNIGFLKEIGGGCDEEAMRVVKVMPRWNPGKQNGIPVRVRLTLPVKFSLL